MGTIIVLCSAEEAGGGDFVQSGIKQKVLHSCMSYDFSREEIRRHRDGCTCHGFDNVYTERKWILYNGDAGIMSIIIRITIKNKRTEMLIKTF